MTDYLVIYEKSRNGYSAYVPDLPGCTTAGADLPEIERNMAEAIKLYLGLVGELKPFTTSLTQSKSPATRMQKTVVKYNLGEEPHDADYWVTQSPYARVLALETLRNQKIDQNGLESRLQRVYRVVEQA